jgi:hypothetical protein
VPIMKRRKEATGRSVREHVKEPLLSSCCESSNTGEDAIVVKDQSKLKDVATILL